MAELRKVFTDRLRAAMNKTDWKGVELARALDKAQTEAGLEFPHDPVTISRWRRGTTLPKRAVRRKVEEVMGLNSGYLDGLAEDDLDAVAKRRTLAVAESARAAKPKDDPVLTSVYKQAVQTLGKLADQHGGLLPIGEVIGWLTRLHSIASGAPVSDPPVTAAPLEEAEASATITSPESGAKPAGELEHATRHREQARADVAAASPPPGRGRRRTGQG